MPVLLNNPAHWHLRAQEARLLASQLDDPEAKAATLKIDDEYALLFVQRNVWRSSKHTTVSSWQQQAERHLSTQLRGRVRCSFARSAQPPTPRSSPATPHVDFAAT